MGETASGRSSIDVEREIIYFGEPVLRRKCKPVKAVDRQIRKLLDDMVETMRANDGVGLAAPQVGVAKRVLVAEVGDQLIHLVNPIIVERTGSEVGIEGCLSIPGLQGNVERSRKLTVAGLDRAGRETTVEAEGLLARCLQHEIDHLNGTLFVDRTDEIWWLEEVDVDELDDDTTAELAEGQVLLRRVPTTLAEVEEYFADFDPTECDCDECDCDCGDCDACAADDEPEQADA